MTLGFLVFVSVHKHAVSFDLSHAYLPAAHRMLRGHSPFPRAAAAALRSRTAYVYPPLTAWLVAPLTVLPLPVAEAIGLLLMLASVVTLLALLGVTDWRCYMIALLWLPTYSAIQTANLDLPVAAGVAAVWKARSRPWFAGLATGLLIALKLFLWPLAIWLLATRRVASAVVAAVSAFVLVLVSWAPIGFSGLRGYPHLLETLSQAERADGYTLAALIAPALSWPAATAIGVAVGLLVLVWGCRAAYQGDERGGFVLTIAAVLMLTPIVWLDYFVLLLVVVGLSSRTFGWLWLLPLGLWAAPQVSNGAPWQTAGALVLGAATIGVAARSGRRAAGSERMKNRPDPEPAR